MQELYTVLAAIVVKYLVDGLKFIGAWISQMIPTLPPWVKNLLPLWKLLTAIAVTVLVVWASKKWAVELSHPLLVLVLAQVVHEITDAISKTRAEG